MTRFDPLLLFLVCGAALFGLWYLVAPSDRETIRIEPAALRLAAQQQADLLGRPLTERELEDLLEDVVEEEVLLREALRRGLQFSDYRVRRRLVQILRGSLTETVADPSVAQLQAYYRDNIDNYTSPPSRTYEQIFFPWGDSPEQAELEEILGEVRQGARPDTYGETSPLAQRVLRQQTRRSLVMSHGADFADSLEQLSDGEWHGPFESAVGVHLVREIERHPAQVAAFENIESYLRQDWLLRRTRELQQEGVDAIRRRYRTELVEVAR